MSERENQFFLTHKVDTEDTLDLREKVDKHDTKIMSGRVTDEKHQQHIIF